jgi:TonB-dependent starch-binding outer membrane protein SusC
MKHNTTLLFLIAAVFFHTNANAYSQGITLKVADASLDKVFTLIQKQTKFVFVYSAKQLAGTKRVSVDVKDEKLEKVLQMVLDGQPLRYEVDKEYVIIKVKMPRLVGSFTGEPGEIVGRVTNEKGEPVAGATVTVKNSSINAATDLDGYFTLKGVDTKGELVITSIGYEPKIVKLTGEEKIAIKMIVSAQTIKEVVIKGSTGFQVIDRKNPGSFNVVDNELLNRRVGSDILSRLKDIVPGLSFNNPNDGLLIRGRNSIYSNVNPLVVLDNFPYDGDINNINPNDVESVTVLKDAAAAALWGARAGNGVIVITTKKGKSSKPQIEFNSNLSIELRPNIKKLKLISSSDEIELEKWLFEQGYYDGSINNTYNYPPLTPVQELLLKVRNGELDHDKANALIESYKLVDVKDDLQKYFYQKGIAQQYALNVSGSSALINYYFSAGFDKSQPTLVGNHSNRVTLKSINTFRVANNIDLDAGITYTQQNIEGSNNAGININSGAGKGLYPYADLVDKNGNGLPLVKDYRIGYSDTVGGGKLLNWKYSPYNDINTTRSNNRSRDFIINTGFRYRLRPIISIELKYQFENYISNSFRDASVDAYSTRDLINKFYQPYSNNKYPVPVGGIRDAATQELISHQGRLQINYNQTWKKHQLSAILGWEIKDLKRKGNSHRIYGYNEEGSQVYTMMDFVTQFPMYNQPFNLQRIINMQSVEQFNDRFLSYFSTIQYTFDSKYTLNASGRQDAANLFGVKTNQRGVPLWSIGGGWQINKENFYNLKFISSLRLRTSYGITGNIARTVSGVTTFRNETYQNFIGLPMATIVNPPNEKLRWEQDRIFNLGLDFELKNNIVSGTIEYFRKHNKDLMAQAPIDPTSGLTPVNGGPAYYFGNVASMKGNGFEVQITTRNLNRKFQWNTVFLFSYALNKVSAYYLPPPVDSRSYVGGESNINPIVGKPIFSFYSYMWGGLDPENGDPMGYYGKNNSKDYSTILNNTKVDSLVYHGSAQPPIFGALRNSFSFKRLSISVNVNYAFGFYIRRPVLSYQELYNSWNGSSDYSRRWQNKGDEKSTDIPSRVYVTYPNFGDRETFYFYSQAAVLRGDQIRLDDIKLDYTLSGFRKKVAFNQIRIYCYLSDLGAILWRANDLNIDPSFPNGRINRMRISVGASLIL